MSVAQRFTLLQPPTYSISPDLHIIHLPVSIPVTLQDDETGRGHSFKPYVKRESSLLDIFCINHHKIDLLLLQLPANVCK